MPATAAKRGGAGKRGGGSGGRRSAQKGGSDLLAAVPEPGSRWGKLILVLVVLAVIVLGGIVYTLWTRRGAAESAGTAASAASVSVAAPVVHSGFIRAGGDGVARGQGPVMNAPALAINPTSDPVYPLRGVPQGIQQMGVLVSVVPEGSSDQPQVLPLLGRPAANHRDRWEYYTSTDQYNMMRLPVSVDGRECQEDAACREIYNGDTISVPTYKKEFIAQIYKYEKPQYNPTGPSTVTLMI